MLRLKSIQQMKEIMKLESLMHDHLLLLDYKNAGGLNNIADTPFTSDLYAITLKDKDCGIKYGRKSYDFSEGSLIFTGPDQVISFESQEELSDGWLLLMHPDLFRKSDLGKRIHEYTFFNYGLNEALHISEREKTIIQNIVDELKEEMGHDADDYSEVLLISSIELLLNYCKRFYGRQFITRKAVNNDVIVRFEGLLNERINPEYLESEGTPTVKSLAKNLGYSANYLSDLLRKETGMNTQEYIHSRLLDLSKTMLLTSGKTISEISYLLGFSYPAHFSTFFKGKVGMSPVKYRKANI